MSDENINKILNYWFSIYTLGELLERYNLLVTNVK